MELTGNKKYYYRYRDKILERKRKHYQRNKEKIKERQKGFRKSDAVQKTEELQRKTKSLDEVILVLRKDKSHYLWSKPVVSWSKSDWEEFNKIE